MKLSQSRRGFLLVVIAGACLLPSVSSAAITVVGTGPDSSFLVLESPNLGLRTYEVRYTYNSGAPQDAYFLLSEVQAAESYVIVKSNYGSPSAPNYFIDSINGEANDFGGPSPTYAYWYHWVSAGFGFQGPAPTYNYDSGAAPADIWTDGYGVSSHFIEPGSWDALVYTNAGMQPSIAPVPETSSVLLTLLGSLVIFKRRRNVA